MTGVELTSSFKLLSFLAWTERWKLLKANLNHFVTRCDRQSLNSAVVPPDRASFTNRNLAVVDPISCGSPSNRGPPCAINCCTILSRTLSSSLELLRCQSRPSANHEIAVARGFGITTHQSVTKQTRTFLRRSP
jgi:hypothetical protein